MDRPGTCQHRFGRDCFLLLRVGARTISECSAGMRWNGSCIGLAARSIETNSHSKARHFLRFGPGRRTGLQRTRTCSAEVCRLPSRKLKQLSGKSVPHEKMMALFLTLNRWKAPGSKKMTNTMEYESNFRPSWLEREFRCRSISVLAMPFIPNQSLPPFRCSSG